MGVHKLVLDDFTEDLSFSLIGIHCNLEDYKLAYMLNKYLEINLRRKETDLQFNNGANYSIFEWENEKELKTWNFISNIYKHETEAFNGMGSLFSNEITTRILTLVPEYKKVNYFLKMSDEMQPLKETAILKKIQAIPQIVTAYLIDTEQLISKGNLIF